MTVSHGRSSTELLKQSRCSLLSIRGTNRSPRLPIITQPDLRPPEREQKGNGLPNIFVPGQC